MNWLSLLAAYIIMSISLHAMIYNFEIGRDLWGIVTAAFTLAMVMKVSLMVTYYIMAMSIDGLVAIYLSSMIVVAVSYVTQYGLFYIRYKRGDER